MFNSSQRKNTTTTQRRSMCLVFALCVCGLGQVHAGDENHPQDLPSVPVHGSPFYIPSFMNPFLFSAPPMPRHQFDSIPLDGPDLTKEEACQILANAKPTDGGPNKSECKLDNFPAAPGFPSFVNAPWSGNGCGAGMIANIQAKYALFARHPQAFSHDLDFPLKGYPSVSFTVGCNEHDMCYTINGMNKHTCAVRFQVRLDGFCDTLGAGTPRATCQMLAADYYFGVDKHADDAYAEDQSEANCSEWGNAMKKNRCHE